MSTAYWLMGLFLILAPTVWLIEHPEQRESWSRMQLPKWLVNALLIALAVFIGLMSGDVF